ncbi:MAG TPA: class I SAM-dependent methyltransferase, partial [Pseudonocardiaceae bacterium]
MDLGFRGEVADFYHRYRRGYPQAVIDSLVAAFGLGADDVVVDLGCGTGQLTVPLAARVRAVVGMDPEPDMLAYARRAGSGVANVSWLVGADTDLPALGALLGDRSVAAITIGQALHWMDHDEVFRAAATLVRPGGGVAVVTNGVPMWRQDSPWSHALRDYLEEWLGMRLSRTCGTDEAGQQRYRDSMAAAGLQVRGTGVDYEATLDSDQIVGGVYSALSVNQLPDPADRPRFAA